MRIDNRRLVRARQYSADRVLAEVPGLVCGPDFVLIAAIDNADLKAVGRMRLQFLDAAAGDVRGVVQPRNAIVTARAINLELRNILVSRDEQGSLARETLQLPCIDHRIIRRPRDARASAGSAHRWTSASPASAGPCRSWGSR